MTPFASLRHYHLPVSWVLGILLLGVGSALSPALGAAEAATEAGLWQRWEGRLTARNAPVPADVEIDVRFTGPDGATLQVPAFRDAEGEFLFRAAFPRPGLWRWQSSCSTPTDTGLHGRTGEVRVAAYAGLNPLYRHGDLRVSADRRYLTHADGTPFLWLGDTAWNAAARASTAEWQEYVATRVRQRFSVLQVVINGIRLRNGMGATAGPTAFRPDGTPNPPYWQDLDAKVAQANDQGLFVLFTGLGDPRAGSGELPRPPGFVRFVAARFAGHMVILSPSMDQRYEVQNDEAGRRLRGLTTHLVTQHPGTHFETAKRYHEADYADFSGLQTGHHGGKLDRAYDAARAWTLELWRRTPIKPVINIEAMYDGYGHDDAPNWRPQDARKLGWLTWLSGSRGYTYGAGDVPPKIPGAAGGIWLFNTDPAAYDHWRKALQWPSAAQMTHLRDFFAGLPWWRLEPAPERVKNQPDDPLRRMVASRSADGDLLVAYLPDNPEIVLDLQGLPGALAGRWFNPITGESRKIAQPFAPDSAAALRRPAEWADAALVVTASAR